MLLQKKNTFCFLDIGTYKTTCFICEISKGDVVPLSLSVIKTKGIRQGKIYDARDLKEAVLAAVYDAEQSARKTVDEVIMSMPSSKIYQKRAVVRDRLFGKQVLKEDIKKLVNKALVEIDASKHEVIHFFPTRFCLDSVTIVKNPESLFADHIEAEISLLYTKLKYLVHMATILASCHLKPLDFILDSFASSVAVCEDITDEKFLVIDIGGDTSSIIQMEGDQVVFSDFVGLGGNNITKDIAAVFSISLEEAERIKTVYGGVLPCGNKETVQIKQFSGAAENEPNSINKKVLNEVILARAEEIIERIQKKTSRKKCKRIFLTGGGAKLLGIDELFGNRFKKQTEILYPCDDFGMKELEKNPSYSTIVGMVKCFLSAHMSKTKINVSKNPLKKIFFWLRENF